jgi:hypothetical protein
MKRTILNLLTLMSIFSSVSCSNMTSETSSKTKDSLQKVQAIIQKLDTSTSSLNVQYMLSSQYPSMADSVWKPLSNPSNDELKIDEVAKNQPLWIRVADIKSDSLKWNVYGPLRGENQTIDITKVIETETSTNFFELESSNEKNINKGLKCCKVRIKVRVRVVVNTPSVTVRNPIPEITLNWRKPIPSITVKGPDIVVEDLPRLPSIDSPIPADGTPDVGMFCEMSNNEAVLFIQNAESKPVDVWIIWKGVNLGPSRIEPKSMRSLGKTGYNSCEAANENIYITKAKFPGGW